METISELQGLGNLSMTIPITQHRQPPTSLPPKLNCLFSEAQIDSENDSSGAKPTTWYLPRVFFRNLRPSTVLA